MRSFAGQTVVVTGAGAGIGRALALGLCSQGAHVFAIGRTRGSLEETRQLCSGLPGTLSINIVDVSDAVGIERCLREIVAERGHIDLLINGAAVYPRALVVDASPDSWVEAVRVNLMGVVNACRVLQQCQPAGCNCLVLNVGTFAHLGPTAASASYCATKAAVHAFTKAWAVELATDAPYITANEWVPGIFKTQMSGYTGEDPARAFDYLSAVVAQSESRPGGRVFGGPNEMLPRRSLRERVMGLLRRPSS